MADRCRLKPQLDEIPIKFFAFPACFVYNYHIRPCLGGGELMNMEKFKMRFLPTSNSKKIILIVVFILGAFISINLARVVFLNIENENRLSQRRNEVLGLEEEVGDLENQLEYYRSNEFLEKEARDKLQMVKPNETIIVIPEEIQKEIQKEADEANNQTQEQKVDTDNNLEQWVQLFFGENNHQWNFRFDF